MDSQKIREALELAIECSEDCWDAGGDRLDELAREALAALEGNEWLKCGDTSPPNHVAIEARVKLPGRYFNKTGELTLFVGEQHVNILLDGDDEWRLLPPPPQDKGDD